jgi:hypothetical protein
MRYLKGTQKVKNMTYSGCVHLPKLTWSLRKNFQNKRNRRTSCKVKYDKINDITKVGLSLEDQGALITVEWSLRPPDQAPLYSNTCGSSRDQHQFCTFIKIKKNYFSLGCW